VGVGPYPGYVHGSHPQICPKGCVPDALVLKSGRSGESVRETLLREAQDYLILFHKENGLGDDACTARISAVIASIEATGTYEHTLAELEYGAQVAWRNAPKCANRKHWSELKLVDARRATTATDMFDACCSLLDRAVESSAALASIVVFRPQTPGTLDGPRVWNSQLLRFAGYRMADGSVRGDPAELGFAQVLESEFGWKPPVERGMFDIMPLLLQPHPDAEPEMFTLPKQYCPTVPLSHPQHAWFAELNLRWYGIPVVAALDMDVGGACFGLATKVHRLQRTHLLFPGLTYTAAPFNGWYSVTEITRNLTDEGRYNLAPLVGAKLGLDVRSEAALWRDMAMSEIARAVLHSFARAGIAMVDHHTLLRSFMQWYPKELAERGYCPGNWKWIMPPIAASAGAHYLGLSKMTEYTLKPGYFAGPGWYKLRRRWLDNPRAAGSDSAARVAANSARINPAVCALVLKASSRYKQRVLALRSRVCILYATATGTAKAAAMELLRLLSEVAMVTVLDLSTSPHEALAQAMRETRLLLIVTSTFNSGEVPTVGAARALRWLRKEAEEGRSPACGVPFSVLGLGSTAYPRFCAAAFEMHEVFAACAAIPLLPQPGCCDAQDSPELAKLQWLAATVAAAADAGFIPTAKAARLAALMASNAEVECDYANSLPMTPPFTAAPIKLGTEAMPVPMGAFEAVVSAARPLAGAAHLTLALPPYGAEYTTGDTAALWALNDPADVNAVLAALGLVGAADHPFIFRATTIRSSAASHAAPPFPSPITFRVALSACVALRDTPTLLQLRALRGYVATRAALAALGPATASYEAYAARVRDAGITWARLFDAFPPLAEAGALSASAFFACAPHIRPRYYSIASAPGGGSLDVVVSQLTYHHAGSEQRGFASTWLNCAAVEGTRLGCNIIINGHFRLPNNPASPVVMVGAGAGVAPLRGMWQEVAERRARAAQGQPTPVAPIFMLYGCRSRDAWLFREEMSAHAGIATSIAFSRQPGEPKRYVQSLVADASGALLEALQHPRCVVLVCGGVEMAVGVNEALREVLGAVAFKAMRDDGRLRADVFGAKPSDKAKA